MDGYENQDELYGQKEPNPQDESKPSQYYAYGEAESSGTYTEPVYGEGDETNGWYRAYEETPKPRKEGSGFAKKLVPPDGPQSPGPWSLVWSAPRSA